MRRMRLCGSGSFRRKKAPEKAEEGRNGFEIWPPVSVMARKLGPIELLNTLNEIAAKHG